MPTFMAFERGGGGGAEPDRLEKKGGTEWHDWSGEMLKKE